MKRSIFLVLLLCSIVAQATTRRVLFIGNSYTYTNNMPLMLQNIAAAMGDTLVYDESDPGGYTLQQHTVYAPTITKIFSQQWDLVVIQEQSELPAFPLSQVITDVYPYATRLDSMVHANDTCTQTMFMMTWGHANGDPPNCAAVPEICTYDGMQQHLRESYMQMALDNHAIVAPVGMAYKIMMDSTYSPWLYSADSSHPVVPGSYIEACVLYGSIFHRPALNCSYLSGLAAADAHLLQRVADKVVFDSLALWQGTGHYPSAYFTATLTGNDAAFTAYPGSPASHSWSFGDLVSDTAASPVHHYSSSGIYAVTHMVSTACFTEKIMDTLHIGTTAVPVSGQQNNSVVVAAGSNTIRYLCTLAAGDELEIMDMNGRLLRRFNNQSLPAADQLVTGMYLYRLYTRDGASLETGKFVVR